MWLSCVDLGTFSRTRSQRETRFSRPRLQVRLLRRYSTTVGRYSGIALSKDGLKSLGLARSKSCLTEAAKSKARLKVLLNSVQQSDPSIDSGKKLCFYVFTTIYTQRELAVCPLLWIPPNRLSD